MTVREVVAESGGLALVELVDGDLEHLAADKAGPFDVDEDPRPPLHEPWVHRLGVVLDGELVGTVSWHATGYGHSFPNTAWNVGIGLVSAARGKGTGVRAMRLLAQFLFATTEVDRIEAQTGVDNTPAQWALAKAGFQAEGKLRGAQQRDGQRRDMIQFGMLRTDLDAPPAGGPRDIVIERDGVGLAAPVPGERERFFTEAGGDFEVDRDERPSIAGPVRTFLLSILDTDSGELLGGVSWHAVDYGGTLGCQAWNIGIGLVPAARGRGVGTLAQRLLVEHLFATTEVDRVEAGTDVENVGEQRALEKAGFRREGVLRGTQLRGGIRHNLVHYGILRSDLDPGEGPRKTFAEGAGVVLAESRAEERQQVFAAGGPFDTDPDPRPRAGNAPEVHRASVLEAGTGRLLGTTDWHVVGYGDSRACAAWNFGISLLPEVRGRGIGTIAQRLLAEHLFATTDLDRVEAGTDVDNLAERRALEKAGFRQDGVIRGAQLRGGRRTDMVIYGRLRGDLEPPAGPRRTLAERGGVALADLLPADREQVMAVGEDEFDVDEDRRPRQAPAPIVYRAAIVDAGSGELLGATSWHAVDYGPTLGCSAWNLGIVVLPSARGRGVGTIAQRLLADHLFATTELDRVEAGTDVDNIAERRALVKAGFIEDGTIRGAQLRGGERRDLVFYARLRTDR
ncbi:MAG TPA: GNAT family protein [Actinophytocola sp.]|jgi:RimJ/RimL family protein N-acetyltransferase|uniref:GNAT family N-acetyltransferase n=1 Tax=Actinophytocola sp. TaxID=1872138 RepID=UPI002F95A8FE